jgi:hypothetical protein
MADNFSQTVDLREEMERKQNEKKKKVFHKPKPDPIEKIYGPGKEDDKKDLQKITVPQEKKSDGPALRIIFILTVFALAGIGIWWIFFKGAPIAGKPEKNSPSVSTGWYSVKLVDGEIFYGQIADTAADPVIIKNVYYNYDQTKDANKPVDETASLKLVKRGKETHGPDGSMDVVRAQVIYMESLSTDSKVLQAILQYEK